MSRTRKAIIATTLSIASIVGLYGCSDAPRPKAYVNTGTVDAIISEGNELESALSDSSDYAVMLSDGSCGWINPDHRFAQRDFAALKDAQEYRSLVKIQGEKEILYGASPGGVSGIPCTIVDKLSVKRGNAWAEISGKPTQEQR